MKIFSRTIDSVTFTARDFEEMQEKVDNWLDENKPHLAFMLMECYSEFNDEVETYIRVKISFYREEKGLQKR